MDTIKFAENLSIFVEVMQAKSFSAVARRKGMVASSVARQIDALEAELKVALFTRSTRALAPTDAGSVLFERAVKILHDISDARDEVVSLESDVRGQLRVSCLPAFARRHIIPILGSLQGRYPGLQVELELTERTVDPIVERVDLVIRVGMQPDSSLIGQCVGTHRYIPCAAPTYLMQHGTPQRLADLADHRLVDRRHSTSVRGWRELLDHRDITPEAFILECDDCDARRLAVLDGLGIGLMPNWSIGEDIATGRLVELDLKDANVAPASGIYLLRALPRATVRIRAFTEHLIEHIGEPNRWEIAIGKARTEADPIWAATGQSPLLGIDRRH